MVEEAPDPRIRQAERLLKALEELTELAMAQARAVVPDGSEAAANAFAKDSRAVRLTVTLEFKIGQALHNIKAGLAPKPKTAEELSTAHRDCQKRVARLVMDAADRECETPDEFDTLVEALNERLDDDEAYLEIIERPLRETLERICEDLTLSPDWSRWDGEGWIDDGPPQRPSYSVFNTPSARPLLRRKGGEKLATPAPPCRLRAKLE